METAKTPIFLRSLCINYLLFGSLLTLAADLLLGFVNNDLSELQCSFKPQIEIREGQSKKQNCDLNNTFSLPYHLLASI